MKVSHSHQIFFLEDASWIHKFRHLCKFEPFKYGLFRKQLKEITSVCTERKKKLKEK